MFVKASKIVQLLLLICDTFYTSTQHTTLIILTSRLFQARAVRADMSRESKVSRQEVEEIILENEGVLLEKVAEFSQQNSVRILFNC